MTARLDRMRRDDAGFTLPEVLVAVVIICIVMPALAVGFFTGLKATDDAVARVSASNDAGLAAAYFVTDVQSAEAISTTAAAGCTTPAGSENLLTLTRTTATATVVTGYAYVDGSPKTMVRYSCTGAVADPTVTLGHDLASKPAVNVVLGRQAAIEVTDTTGYSFTLDATRRTS